MATAGAFRFAVTITPAVTAYRRRISLFFGDNPSYRWRISLFAGGNPNYRRRTNLCASNSICMRRQYTFKERKNELK
jgi:hypothetical protein